MKLTYKENSLLKWMNASYERAEEANAINLFIDWFEQIERFAFEGTPVRNFKFTKYNRVEVQRVLTVFQDEFASTTVKVSRIDYSFHCQMMRLSFELVA